MFTLKGKCFFADQLTLQTDTQKSKMGEQSALEGLRGGGGDMKDKEVEK